MQVDPTIFKAYDIRGIVDVSLTEDVVQAIGRVLGTRALEKGVHKICVGRDGRLTGPRLMQRLMQGLKEVGMHVYDLGAVPTPVVYFASTLIDGASAVAVTGSHNPPQYNGLKMMLAGVTLYAQAIESLKEDVQLERWQLKDGGCIEDLPVLERYLQWASRGRKIARPMKIVIDAGNGIAGPTALQLLQRFPLDIQALYCEPDGNFPNHHPDPSKQKNLEDLIQCVQKTQAEVGLAFDGDGDRLGVVTRHGQVIYPDRLMMLYAADMLKRYPNAPIVYDVKCSRKLVSWIQEHGGQPTISPTGHSLVKAKLRQTQAPFAGEMSGHLFFNDEGTSGFDDGVYAALRLLEILSQTPDATQTLEQLPDAVNTPEIQIPMLEGQSHQFIEKFQKLCCFEDAQQVITVDGVRVEWPHGFALVRASNTTPILVVRLEGDTAQDLQLIRQKFLAELKRVDPTLAIDF